MAAWAARACVLHARKPALQIRPSGAGLEHVLAHGVIPRDADGSPGTHGARRACAPALAALLPELRQVRVELLHPLEPRAALEVRGARPTLDCSRLPAQLRRHHVRTHRARAGGSRRRAAPLAVRRAGQDRVPVGVFERAGRDTRDPDGHRVRRP